MLLNRIVIILTALFVFIVGVISPDYNWDIIGYVASSYYKDGLRGKELSEKTYNDIKTEVGKEMFISLTAGYKGYREGVYTNSNSLEQQIPFYSIKMVYVEFMRMMKVFGISYPKATYIISAFFSSFSVIILGLILFRKNLSMVTLPVIVLTTGFLEMAQLSTPDALACFFSFAAIYFSLNSKRIIFLISAILPLIRTDLTILSTLLMLHWYLKSENKYSLISLIFSFMAYFIVNSLNGNYGWLTLFNFSFFGYSPFPADMVISNRIKDYIWPYVDTLLSLPNIPQFLIYFVSIYILLPKVINKEIPENAYEFFIIPFLYVVIHLALFPIYENRFFVFSSSIMFVGMLTQFKDHGLAKYRPDKYLINI